MVQNPPGERWLLVQHQVLVGERIRGVQGTSFPTPVVAPLEAVTGDGAAETVTDHQQCYPCVMGVTEQRAFVTALRDHVGDGLRVVADYDRDGYDVIYTRDGVEQRVQARADEVHRELVLQGIGREHLEDMFGAGSLHCSMHRFDDLTAFHFVQDEYTGCFVSIDSDVHVDLPEFSATVHEFVE